MCEFWKTLSLQTEAGSHRKLEIMSFKVVLINVKTPDKPVLSGQGARPSSQVLYKVYKVPLQVTKSLFINNLNLQKHLQVVWSCYVSPASCVCNFLLFFL